MEQQSKLKFLTDLTFSVTVGLIIYICGRFLIGYLLPFVIAALIAWWVQKPARKIASRLKCRLSICAAFFAVIFFLIAAAIIFFIFYRLTLSAKELLSEAPKIVNTVTDFLERIKSRLGDIFLGLSPEMFKTLNGVGENMLETFTSTLTGAVSSLAASVAKRAPSFLFSCIVALVASCYIAKDYEILVKFLRELFGKRVFSKILEIKEIITQSVWKILKGYAVLMLITFTELAVGFFALGVSNPFILAVLISFIDLLPVFGTGTVLIPWGIAAISLGNSQGFGILVLYIIITVVRNFAEPKIIGDQIGINPLFTLLVMFAGLKIMGFWGLIIFPIVFIVTIKYYKRQLKLEKTSN